jgi:F-type H+-transporting ATPase subunit a
MASDHPTYLTPLIPETNMQAVLVAMLIGTGLVGLGVKFAKIARQRSQSDEGIIPSAGISLFGLVDLFTETFLSFQDSVMGRENRRYFPFMATLFLFLLCGNIIGLIPGMPVTTGSIGITLGFALASFVYFNFHGLRENGFFGYCKHFSCGIRIVFLAVPIFFLELLSTVLRVLTLNLRLYWNITADHLVLGVFTELLGFAAIPAYILGTFVALIQAFVFTTLSMVYVQLATQHSDTHEEEHG